MTLSITDIFLLSTETLNRLDTALRGRPSATLYCMCITPDRKTIQCVDGSEFLPPIDIEFADVEYFASILPFRNSTTLGDIWYAEDPTPPAL